MELSWLMKLRIAAAAAVGIVLVYFVGRHVAGSPDRTGEISYMSVWPLIILAFLAGLIAYVVAWPYGREIGILAAPFGLAVWAFRAGSMTALIQQNPAIARRRELIESLRLEPLFWLAVVGAGFAGVLLAQKMRPGPERSEMHGNKTNSSPAEYLNALIAMIGSAVIASICLKACAQDVRVSDNNIGPVVGQPATAQIALAVLVSLGVAAFASKKLLNASYIWPAMASSLVTVFALSAYARNMPYIAKAWPATFFGDAAAAVLPVQMVAFGALGSVAGYWTAIRYDYWRKHEMK